MKFESASVFAGVECCFSSVSMQSEFLTSAASLYLLVLNVASRREEAIQRLWGPHHQHQGRHNSARNVTSKVELTGEAIKIFKRRFISFGIFSSSINSMFFKLSSETSLTPAISTSFSEPVLFTPSSEERRTNVKSDRPP
nr:hypothetical protein [Tanacetum cinerariifolium]